jgi:peptidoglycan/LPS O-acetylase OafA/YrhL
LKRRQLVFPISLSAKWSTVPANFGENQPSKLTVSGTKSIMKNGKEGIDYLRACMSMFVVVWHMGGGGQSLIYSEERFREHVFTLSDFINFHVLLLAVPAFVFISIYLYSSKPISLRTFKNRFTRIFILLTFWPIALILYKNGYPGLLDIVPNSPVDAVYTALGVGDTIYYFFSSLIICLFIAHLFLQLNRNLQLSIFVISIVLLASLPHLTKISGFYPLSAYWNPLNFIPLTFAAAFLARNESMILEKRNMALLLSVVSCVFLSIFEWKYSVGQIFFPGQGYAFPAYTRASLLFAVFAIFILALSPKIKSNNVIRFMARYSLALYCLHPFMIRPVKKFVFFYIRNQIVGLYVSIILVIMFSYFAAIMLRKYYLREEAII